MSTVDPKVASILDRSNPTDTDLDEDALFDALEQEDDSAYRAHRAEQLRSELNSAKDAFRQQQQQQSTSSAGGVVTSSLYPTLPDDQAVLDFTTSESSSGKCVLHFFHPDFSRCSVMDTHLETLAGRHYEVRFARVDVSKAPFVVGKLGVRVLPCVIGFKDGVGVERVVGFEGLGSKGTDAVSGFRTEVLERRLAAKGVLVREKLGEESRNMSRSDDEEEEEDESDDDDVRKSKRRGIRSGNTRASRDDEEDDDWD
ncbi:hypothetical protein FQN54_007433 [Arachnomyces sp. PD_36]|nr:hypothetical protein FQN54_007433 [Arachnomyces sp. PD_36]